LSKIIIIGPAHPLRGGIAALNERLAIQLQDEGHEVTIYSFSLQYPGFLFPGTTQKTSDPAPEGLKIVTRINSVNPFNWFAVGREIRQQSPDLVLVRFWLPFMGPSLGTILRRIAKNKKTKIICIADNIIPHEGKPGDRMFTKYFLKPVQGLLAMSRAVLEDLNQFDRKKPRVFSPHPVYDIYGDSLSKEVAREALSLDQEGRYLLFFGLIRDYKGLDLALKALADPRLKALGVKLVVAGEFYQKPEETHALITELELADRVELRTYFIPNAEVGSFFCASDMVVQPYKTATQSGVTQIAYHFDRPMLVTDVGGLPEIVPHEKVGYVTPRDPKIIADSLVDFYEKDREAEFTANVKEEKKRFQWDHFVAELFRLADQIKTKP
jgi:glycosyltransferase involved in cell wall biosynthesis